MFVSLSNICYSHDSALRAHLRLKRNALNQPIFDIDEAKRPFLILRRKGLIKMNETKWCEENVF